MKVLISAALVALTLAEPPPSRSYLPPALGINISSQRQDFGPSPANGGLDGFHGTRTGHAGGGALGHDHQRNVHSTLARDSRRGYSIPHNKLGSAGYDQNSASIGRNSFEDSNNEPANYNFGYMVNDQEGAEFGHHEERSQERAQGEYHVVLPDGKKQTVNYEADESGFKPQISYEDAEIPRSGYDHQALHGNGGSNDHFGGY